MSSTKLKVCDACGWYDAPYTHKSECNAERGRTARGLALSVDVPSTVLGYGFGRQAFRLGDRISEHNDEITDLDLVLLVNNDCFVIMDLYSVGQYSREAMQDLIKALKEWRGKHQIR